MDEDVAVPHLAASAMQWKVVLAEVRRHVRRGEQPSFQAVRPVVIRALDTIGKVPLALLA
jgi:hypothetical protein